MRHSRRLSLPHNPHTPGAPARSLAPAPAVGVPWYGVDMTEHPQYVTIRNRRGREMFDMVAKDMYM